MTDVPVTIPTVQVTPEPAPTAGGRFGRSAGQMGGVVVLLDLWLAFGWLGADGWSERQVLAVTAASYLVASGLHNLVNWWRTERHVHAAPPAVTVRAADESGRVSDLGLLVIAVVVAVVLAVLLT
jgi:hypothetical protein